jgi:alkylation response protein AidB-like acyl-CoA dehydrogenase
MPDIEKITGVDIEKGLGVKPSEFDHFHEQIAHEEMGRLNSPSYCDGLGAGFCIGTPPVLHFAPPHIRDVALPEILRGDKRACLAISEPAAGSDVAGMITTATKSADGKHYIVNGIKKWITNGMFADYFITAVRTGEGRKGISMLFITRDMGVETKAIKTTYSSSAGTALVIYDNVKVPVENLMGMGNKGKEGQGFACIMFNFNHERWFIVSQVIQAMRFQVADCFKWAMQRKAFGKPLMEQPVLRQKLARMAGSVETVHALLENITYQMDIMSYAEQSQKLGGPIALLKYMTTRAATLVSDEAVQMFGGRGITRTGMGQNTERFQKTFKYASILGGSEEVMADLAVRQQIPDPSAMAKL